MKEKEGKDSWHSGCAVGLIVAVLAAILYPAWFQVRDDRPHRTPCQINLRQLGTASAIYASDWNECVPTGSNWTDAILAYTKGEENFNCPQVGKYGYALNEAIAGKGFAEKDSYELGSLPLIFDSSAIGRNVTGPLSLAPDPPRHGQGNNVVYADGRVRLVTLDRLRMH